MVASYFVTDGYQQKLCGGLLRGGHPDVGAQSMQKADKAIWFVLRVNIGLLSACLSFDGLVRRAPHRLKRVLAEQLQHEPASEAHAGHADYPVPGPSGEHLLSASVGLLLTVRAAACVGQTRVGCFR